MYLELFSYPVNHTIPASAEIVATGYAPLPFEPAEKNSPLGFADRESGWQPLSGGTIQSELRSMRHMLSSSNLRNTACARNLTQEDLGL